MGLRAALPIWLLFPAALALSQQAPIVQPGAPGKANQTLTAAKAELATRRPVIEADVTFMQGMIHHHAQAVEMVELLRTRGASKDLLAFGERIAISQTDEMRFMKDWLAERGKPAMPASHGQADDEDHDDAEDAHAGMPLMPGMLTPIQMLELGRAKGAAFDRLFLTGMIQHHNGALDMVDELFAMPGAGQEPVLYDFATDVDNTQRAEIETMRRMLKEIR